LIITNDGREGEKKLTKLTLTTLDRLLTTDDLHLRTLYEELSPGGKARYLSDRRPPLALSI